MDDKYNTSIKKAIDSIIDSSAGEIVDDMFAEIDNSIKNEDINFSQEHIDKINKIIDENAVLKSKSKKITMRMLLVAIVAMSIITMSVLSVGANRLKFLNFFVNIGKNSTEFRTNETLPIDTEQDTQNKYKIILNYIPDNFILSNEIISDRYYYVQYTNNNLYFDVSKSAVPNVHDIDTENSKTEEIFINNNKAFLSSKEDIKILFWTSGNILYNISTNIDENILIDIAKNIE